MFGATFNLVASFGLYHSFRKIENDSLSINILASSNRLYHSNIFENGVSTFSKICRNAQIFVYFGQYEFVQISSGCGSNTYQIMYGETLLTCFTNTYQIMYVETLDFQVSISNVNINCLIVKLFFCSETIPCYRWNADLGTLKSLRTLFDIYTRQVKFWEIVLTVGISC